MRQLLQFPADLPDSCVQATVVGQVEHERAAQVRVALAQCAEIHRLLPPLLAVLHDDAAGCRR